MILALAGIVWLTIVCGAYLVVYPPGELFTSISLPSFTIGAHLLTPLAEGVFFLLMLVSLRGWGLLVLRTAFNRQASSCTDLERELCAVPLGAGMLSLAVLAGNAAGIVSVQFYAALIASGWAVQFLPSIRVAISLRSVTRPSAADIGVAAVLAAPLAASLVTALAPPTQFDSLVYHLALPARYLASGGIHAVPYNIFSSFPQGMEMLFQAALAVRGPVAASLISWMFYPLTALAIYAACSRYFSVRLGVLAAAIWLYTPAVVLISSGGYVDCGLAFYVLMALFAYQRWRDTGGQTGWLAICALLCGAACSIKYTGVIAAVFCVVMMLCVAPRGRKTFSVAVFTILAGAVFSPWLLKNALLFHNPVAPWGTGLFPDSVISAATARAYFEHIASHGTTHGLGTWLLLPWRMTASGYLFGGAFDIPGPLFLLFIPCVLIAGPRLYSCIINSKIIKDILLFTVLFGVLWLCSGKVLRFLIPLVPLLSIGTAAGIIVVGQAGRIYRAGAIIILAVSLTHNMLMTGMLLSYIEPARVVLGGQARQDYLSRKLNFFKGTAAMGEILPAGSHVLYVGETRGFYYDGARTVPTAHDEHPLISAVNSSASPDDAARRLAGAGYTHLFYSDAEARRLSFESRMTAHGASVWQKFMQTRVNKIYKDAYCGIYEIID